MAPPAFGESLAQLDAIIAKLEGGESAAAATPAQPPAAAAAPAPAPAPEKKAKKAKAPAPQPKKKNAPAGPQPLFTKLDLRVGKIVKVWEHPDSEKLWCEEIDVGEDKPRQIVSGLRAWYTKEQMLGKRLIAVCNLKTAKLGGVPSAGMVMCAQSPKDADGKQTAVEFIEPPEAAPVGERVGLEGLEMVDPITPAQVKKQKVWEEMVTKFTMSADKVALFDGKAMTTASGNVTAPNLGAGNVIG